MYIPLLRTLTSQTMSHATNMHYDVVIVYGKYLNLSCGCVLKHAFS